MSYWTKALFTAGLCWHCQRRPVVLQHVCCEEHGTIENESSCVECAGRVVDKRIERAVDFLREYRSLPFALEVVESDLGRWLAQREREIAGMGVDLGATTSVPETDIRHARRELLERALRLAMNGLVDICSSGDGESARTASGWLEDVRALGITDGLPR